MQKLRAAVADNRRQDTCKTICPYMHTTAASLDTLATDEYPGLARLRAIAGGIEVIDEPPMYVSIGVTTFCNLRCVMCRISERDKKNELPDSIYEELYAMASRVKKITFTGGEPLLSKKCLKFLKTLDKNTFPNLNAHIITNGTALTEKLMSDLSSSVLRGLTISLNAATRNTYEKINVGANWDRVIRNIRETGKFIRENKLPVELVFSFVILRSNLQETRAFVHLAKSMGAQVRFMINTNDPGIKWLRLAQMTAGRIPGLSDSGITESTETAREWFIGDQNLCQEATENLHDAINAMKGMSPERITDAHAVLDSLKRMCES